MQPLVKPELHQRDAMHMVRQICDQSPCTLRLGTQMILQCFALYVHQSQEAKLPHIQVGSPGIAHHLVPVASACHVIAIQRGDVDFRGLRGMLHGIRPIVEMRRLLDLKI
jgi:hypothetical protein|mmetsp:Transcript_9399/g.32240  ORF Transcript_9399/g.32240 Transcript_9399/m.32240 type:complete len:110 (+) Transcript_9399:1240-1569(+)